MSEAISCLTVKQPWASLLISGAKRVENRNWPMKHRGRLLIHAGKSLDCIDVATARLPLGAILGSVEVVDCLHIDAIRAGEHNASYPWLRDHDHAEGPWCWVCASPVRFEQPIACTGKLGLWRPAQSVLELVRDLEDGLMKHRDEHRDLQAGRRRLPLPTGDEMGQLLRLLADAD